ncbi:MAG: hypothetical protein Fur0041_11650 [Bacteroidia bacterium]
MSFTYNINQHEPVLVISLYGELLDMNAAAGLINFLNESHEEGKCKFVFDLSELKYMNSSGLNLLISTMTKARKNGGDVVIAGISQKIRELLLITKLNSVFTVKDSIDEAVAHFQ